MISDYLLSQEEAGESVLCVEIDGVGDSQGCLPGYPYGYEYIFLAAWQNFIYKGVSKHSSSALGRNRFLASAIYTLAFQFGLDRAVIYNSSLVSFSMV